MKIKNSCWQCKKYRDCRKTIWDAANDGDKFLWVPGENATTRLDKSGKGVSFDIKSLHLPIRENNEELFSELNKIIYEYFAQVCREYDK